jgi:hypothetical protein
MTKSHDNLKDLELLIRSHYSLIYIETAEEERADSLLKLLPAACAYLISTGHGPRD